MSKRDISQPSKSYLYGTAYKNTGAVDRTYTTADGYVSGYLISSGHPFKKGIPLAGGNFDLRRYRNIRSNSISQKLNYWIGQYPLRYDGRFIANLWHPSGHASATTLDSLDPETYAAELFNMARPAKPDFQAALALLELKDVPSTLAGSTRIIIKACREKWKRLPYTRGGRLNMSNVAEWHLALQFGWAPLVKDYRTLHKGQSGLQEKVAQLLRDNGRPVRRKFVVDKYTTNDESVTVTGQGNTYASPILETTLYASAGTKMETVKVTRKVWCSGRFRYFLPEGPRTVEWKKKLLRRMYGFRITPSVMYNLFPWSWLVDYFTNLGSVMDNLSSGVEDRLICDYFYTMTEVTYRARVQVNFSTRQGSVVTPIVCYTEYEGVRKRRHAGGIFGIGLKPEDLSTNQVAILMALGMSNTNSSINRSAG